MVYDPKLLRDDVATSKRATAWREKGGLGMGFGLASSDDQINPKVLPRRLMEDEIAERFNKLGSAAISRPLSTRPVHSG